jgi:hypothetical protein
MVNITDDDKNYYYSSNSNKVIKDYDKVKKDYAKLAELNIPILDNKNKFRPEYYGGKTNTYEVFNVLEAWELDKDFYLGNVVKYLSRAGKKTINKKEDLQKALVYLQRRIETL